MQLVEVGNKLAIVKRRGCKPRLDLFALLKAFAPGFDPWMQFYKKGLREFLAACGVLEPSANAPTREGAFAEGGACWDRKVENKYGRKFR